MTDEAAHNSKERPLGQSHKPPPRSNKTGILLAGAAAVALLLGGGYYAFKNAGQNPASSQTSSEGADNTTTFASPTAQGETTGADGTTQSDAATADKTDSLAAVDSPAPAKKTRVAAAAIPEETIGVSRVSTPASQSDEVVVNARRPVWRYTPRPERLAEYYPADALERGREGEASLHCIIQKKGALNCEPVSESPARAGFGTAALRVSRTLRHSEQLANGKDAIGTPINLHVVFRMADDERRSSRG